MGDISIIARRLSAQHIQYGWAGNSGYPGTVGVRLWNYYNTPEMVEYLFSLGQLQQLCEPDSENSNNTFRTIPTDRPHWVSTKELDVYKKIAFVDHVYLYDSDGRWYYIAPLIVHIKIQLNIVLNHTSKGGILASDFRLHLERAAFKTVQQWYDSNEQFREYAIKAGYDNRQISELGQLLECAEEIWSVYEDNTLVARLSNLYHYFYPWAVAKTDKSGGCIEKIILRPQNAVVHLETIEWNF